MAATAGKIYERERATGPMFNYSEEAPTPSAAVVVARTNGSELCTIARELRFRYVYICVHVYVSYVSV